MEERAEFDDAGTALIIGACIEVHRVLGPGLLEATYEACLCRELSLRDVPFRRQVALPVEYKGAAIESAYRVDLIVDERVIVELKATDELQPICSAQLLTYLRLSGFSVGLLINFNVRALKNGIRRLENKKNSLSPHLL